MNDTNEYYFPLEQSPGFLVARAARLLKFELRQSLLEAGHDITPEQWGVLCRLWERDGLSQRELAASVCKDMANITRMLDAMEARGLTRREPNPEDRRSHRVFLTDKGRELRAELVPLVRETKRRAFSCLSPEEETQLVDMLNRIYGHLKGADRCA